MFGLWYIVLGAKEYCLCGKGDESKKCTQVPAPSKPDLIPKPSDSITTTKPLAPADIVNEPESLKPSPTPPKPPRPDLAKQSAPRPSPPQREQPQSLPKQPAIPKIPEPLKEQSIPKQPIPLSREDKIFGKTLNLDIQPEKNGIKDHPRDLSYAPTEGSVLRSPERPVISNPDSLESSEAED